MNRAEANRVYNDSFHDATTLPQLSRKLELLSSFLAVRVRTEVTRMEVFTTEVLKFSTMVFVALKSHRSLRIAGRREAKYARAYS